MKLPILKARDAERGFTIVELIIVIVVIGILAAIILVAYGGITNRASDSADKANVDQLVKIAETINADDGVYPSATTSDADLVTAFNSDSTGSTKLPTGVTVKITSAAKTDTDYTDVLAKAKADTHAYYVKSCSTGDTIYYPIRSTQKVTSLSAGQGC